MKYLIVLFLAATLFISIPAEAEDNLVLNAGFEEVESGQPNEKYWAETDDARYWEEVSWGGKRSNLYKYSGQWSLNSWGGDSTEKHGAWQGDDTEEGGATNFISVKPGTCIRFTAYLMSPDVGGTGQNPLSGGAEAFIEIEWRGDNFIGNVESAHLTKTTGGQWKLFSISGTAPAGTTAARFVTKVTCVPGSSGDVYFDDLRATAVSN